MSIKSYSELITIPTYLGRFEYLKCRRPIDEETFGYLRYLESTLYTSEEWVKEFRPRIIVRDCGRDMAFDEDIYILGKRDITIHHINPLTPEDILNRSYKVFDPENVVCVSSSRTHRAIHYSDDSMLIKGPAVRYPNDTSPWKH